MKIGILAGGNPHAIALARHLHTLSVDCFGIGRSVRKPDPLWLAPVGYRYYVAHLGHDLPAALEILDEERPDAIVSFAAQGEGAASFGSDAWRFYMMNCVVLAKVVDALRARDYLRRFVHIGSSEVYGSVDEPVNETAPLKPTSPYSASKATFDIHLGIMHRVHGFPIQIVRPSNCYTAGMQLHRIIPRAMIAARYGKRLSLQGGGAARKSYLDSHDLALAIMCVLERGQVGDVYNCGPDEPISIRSLVEKCADACDVPMRMFVDETPARVGEDSVYWLSSDKIKSLGWTQTVPLGEGLAAMREWVDMFPQLADMDSAYVVRP